MPVGNKVVRDTVQPRREGDAAVRVVLDVIHCTLKDAGGEVLCIVEIPRSIVYVVEDAVYVAFIKLTERIAITL
jgi:hypothetical protein